jgi:hypothetical protein
MLGPSYFLFLSHLLATEPGANWIDEDEIGESKPSLRIIDQPCRCWGNRTVLTQRYALGSQRPEVQPCRARTRPAVEHEGDGSGRRLPPSLW